MADPRQPAAAWRAKGRSSSPRPRARPALRSARESGRHEPASLSDRKQPKPTFAELSHGLCGLTANVSDTFWGRRCPHKGLTHCKGTSARREVWNTKPKQGPCPTNAAAIGPQRATRRQQVRPHFTGAGARKIAGLGSAGGAGGGAHTAQRSQLCLRGGPGCPSIRNGRSLRTGAALSQDPESVRASGAFEEHQLSK